MDSGGLGILKASAWQLLGLSLGLFVFWLFFQFEVLPPTVSLWVVCGLPLAMLIVGGLAYGTYEFPFSVPDHIWTVLEENQDQFPTEFKDRKLPWFRRR